MRYYPLMLWALLIGVWGCALQFGYILIATASGGIVALNYIRYGELWWELPLFGCCFVFMLLATIILLRRETYATRNRGD